MANHATFSIDQSQWEDWMVEARKRKMSKSYMIRQAVESYLEGTQPTPKVLEDLLNENKKAKETMMSYFDSMESILKKAIANTKEEVVEKVKEKPAKPIQKPNNKIIPANTVSHLWRIDALPTDAELMEIVMKHDDAIDLDDLKQERDALSKNYRNLDKTKIVEYVNGHSILDAVRTLKKNGEYKRANDEYKKIQATFGLNSIVTVRAIIEELYGEAP